MLYKKILLTFLFFFIVVTTYSGDKKLVPATGLILVFIVLGVLFLKNNLIVNKYQKVYAFSFLLWIIFLCFSSIHSSSILYGSNKLLFMILYYIFGLVLMLSNIDHNIDRYSILLALCLLLVMLVSFGNPIEVITNINNRFYRLGEEAESNPIVVARGMGMILIFMLFSFSISRSMVIKAIVCILIIITFIYMLVTGSKGPALSLFVSLLILHIVFSNGMKYKLLALVFVIIVGFYFNYFSFGDGFFTERYLNEGSATSRLSQYKLIISAIVDSSAINFIFGHGLGGYSYISTGADIRDYPHNLTLEVLYELGLFGLAMLGWLFIYPIYVRYKNTGEINSFTVILLFFIINTQFSGDLLSNTMWIVFAFLTLSSVSRVELQKL